MKRSAVLISLLLGAPLSGLVAQANIRSSINLSSTTVTFPTATEADYDAGGVLATAPITVTFDARKNGGNQPNDQRTATISIRAGSATLGGSKPISDLQWQLNGTGGSWNGLTTSNAVVDSKPYIFNNLNDPWTAVVYFRTALSWANDGPATYAAVTLTFTLTVTTP